MSESKQVPLDLAEWIVRSLDGTISPEQFALLDQEIVTNREARAYYLEFVTTYLGLMDLVGNLPRAETLMAANERRTQPESSSRIVECPAPKARERKDPDVPRVSPETSEEDRIRQIERYASQQLAAFLAEGQRARPQSQTSARWDLWSGICEAAQAAQRFAAVGARLVKTAAVCLFALGILAIHGLYLYANRTLGMLVDSANAKWEVPVDQTGKLRAGQMTLEEGYARIKLNKGAEVILQAPSTFNLRSTNRMFLESGWITAKVPPAATGFTVKTPDSSIIDFGTEFGLLAGDAGNTEVHVFDGRIDFEQAGPAARPQRLIKNEAITVAADGQTERVAVQQRPHLFVRTMPARDGFAVPGRRLSLADMVGAGNGLDTGVWGQGIDASTGQIASRRTILRKNDNGFVLVPSLPFIDGVFVPDSNDGSVVVTSTGIQFEQCPKTSGTSYESIVNGATFQLGASGEIHYGQLAGRAYDTRTSPSIGMHPNAGITFNLDAVRDAMPEAQIRRFRARCGVSENVVRFAQGDAGPNTIEVTFWVLVDGQPRFSRTLGVVSAQSEQIDVPIGPRDRFLTLATTTPGESRYCWAMFAEPALELVRGKDVRLGQEQRQLD
jgi:ferric-dicitrate binding protein FerR (iron transport regulator)